MEQVFANGNNRDGRDILIKIDSEHIEFFFNEDYIRQVAWIENETENRMGEPLDEDEKANHGFYWIGSDDWISDANGARKYRPDDWLTHMKEKNWFTNGMANFIDKCLNVNRASNSNTNL